MPVAYLSTDTTVFSNLSLTGTLAAPSISGTTVTANQSVVTAATSLNVGGGTAITRISKGTFAVAAMSLATQSSASTAATISGLSTADTIIINPSSSGISAGLSIDWYIPSANTVVLHFSNVTNGPVVQAAATYSYVAIRS